MTDRQSEEHPKSRLIKVIELFAGIGSQHQALKNIGVPHEIVGISEIDKYAIASYVAIHGKVNNLGDITQIEHLPECDLLTYSFPCQDLSVAGHQNGMVKGSGTRSGLLWEVERLLLDMRERDILPGVLLMENVDAILHEKNIKEFQKWINCLSVMGYTSSYKILNASDFGIPQRRMRCFMVSFKNRRFFEFPKPQPLTKCLHDLLEDDVPETYYLSKESIASYQEHKRRHDALGHGFGWRPTYGERESNPLTTNPNRQSGNFIIERDADIRILTPREYFRLMGFSDDAYDRSASVCSKSQLYKQAGNSIVVPVLEAIFREIYLTDEKSVKMGMLEDFI